jgi:hypothetical protein
MTDRCEPPERLREVDGWHWVETPLREPHLARWHAAERGDVEPLWTSTHHICAGTPRYVVREWGWRYLAPAAPPDLVRALVEALTECADDLEAEIAARYNGVRHYPTMAADEKRDMEPVVKARAALRRAKEAGV